MKKKTIFKSKTAAVAVLTALAGLWQPSKDWIAANPQAALSIIAAVSLFLRWVTKDQVVLIGEDE